MARSSRARAGGGGGAKRQAKATSRKAKSAPIEEVEVVEESKGYGIDDGIPILTTIILLVAIVITDSIWGSQYGGGMFFK